MIPRFLVLVLLTASCMAQAPSAARMDEIVQSYVSGKQFMGSVLVARDGKVLFSKAYGSANLEWEIPNTPATRFRIGSITKQFTAACILLLEERGKLKIDDPIKKYIPDVPAAWEKITIYNLLNHTSGIPGPNNYPDEMMAELVGKPEDMIKLVSDKPLKFQPGEGYHYGDINYILLGYLIEKISGQPYADFLRQNIFVPLGMNDSGLDTGIVAHRASGYVSWPKGIYDASTGFTIKTLLASAGIYSTADDLLRWEQGLYGGKILTPASLEKMTTDFKAKYALGLVVKTIDGHKSIWHAGGVMGFSSFLGYYPDDKIAVVVLGNVGGNAPDLMGPQLASAARGEPVVLLSERKEIIVVPEILAHYVGTYPLHPNLSLSITMENKQLMLQATADQRQQPKLLLSAESQTKFFLKNVDLEITFLQNDKGETTGLDFHQGGYEDTAKKQ